MNNNYYATIEGCLKWKDYNLIGAEVKETKYNGWLIRIVTLLNNPKIQSCYIWPSEIRYRDQVLVFDSCKHVLEYIDSRLLDNLASIL